MSFKIKNFGASAVQIADDFIDITIGPDETIDIERLYIGELWRYTFSAQSVPGGGALLTAVTNGDVVRLDDSDVNVAISEAFVDAIWLWQPDKYQWEALVGTNGAPSSTNPYVTDSDPRMTDARVPFTHNTSHLPNGSDPLTVGSAVNVGIANAEGVQNAYSRADHVHQGIHSITSNGTQLFGDVTLEAGSDIFITQNGQTITFDVAASITTEFEVSAGTGLNVNYNAGKAVFDGQVYIDPAGTLPVADNTTSYVYVASNGAVAVGSTLPSYAMPLASVTTLNGAITQVEDQRVYMNQNLVWGETANVSTITPDAVADAGSLEDFARIDHVHAIAANVPRFLGDTGMATATTEGSAAEFSRADHGHAWQKVTAFANLPGSPTDGQTVWAQYGGIYNGLFYWDAARSKWLSMELQMKHWNSGTNSAAQTVNMINNVDDTQQDNDVPNPYPITIVGLFGSQSNAITSGNSTKFEVATYDLNSGTQSQDVADVTLSTVGARAIRNMALNVNVADFTVLSARRLKASGTDNITRPALSVWYRIRLA